VQIKDKAGAKVLIREDINNVPSKRVARIKNGQSSFYHIVLGCSFEQIFRVYKDKFEQDKEGIHAAG
jgi:hypothetical protein